MSFLSSSSAPFPRKRFVYVKPIQTGFPDDSDSRFVYRKFSEFFTYKPLPFSVFVSNSVLKASSPAANAVLRNGMAGGSLRTEAFGAEVVEKGGNIGGGIENVHWYEERKMRGSESNETELFPPSQIVCKTMYAWKEAVSPHLAAEREEAMVGDSEVLHMLKRCLGNGLIGASCNTEELEVMCVIETAGGVASPGPSGSLQCDLYRPFRLPAILVGDGRLGGISGTISAYESLKLRGYDVAAVIFEDHGLVNEVPLLSYFRNRVPVFVLPSIPTDMSDDLMSWFDKSQMIFTSLKEIMLSDFRKRMQRLHDMPKKACDIIWWPFTQHKLVPEEKVTVIDSRCGENFAVNKSCNWISQQFDACASWWTQGPDANLQAEISVQEFVLCINAHGYISFLLTLGGFGIALDSMTLGNDIYFIIRFSGDITKGWASRVYFSDNGSTAVEIALKMAFRKFLSDNKVLLDLVNADVNGRSMDLKVLALRGSYHGDTLGAMEAQAPSPYTGFLQQPWYRGRGHFLDPPTVSMSDDIWEVALPQKMQSGKSGLECLLIQGAGGMQMIDPLYQRILVRECKYRKIPVIFDEVFTGFWRLGREIFMQSAAEMLYCQPDIACFAKLMTGGIIPLAVTLASDAVFEAFTGDSKLKALLHGHSYSAHAMGCAAAVKSVKWFKDSNTNMNLISETRLLQELWDAALVSQISLLPAVHRVVALGTLCAIELLAEGSNAGYASMYASSLLKNLLEDGIYMRPLGNVIYMMCGPCTSPDICRSLLEKVYDRIQEFGLQKDESAVFAA
ncbi:UNVERIFIED_CONTAM: Bifunctional dethiobiotin synthetase/7,8-diamino-pelargonic acid aminotransferase, mitochondrial [Sesamum angustifolium]|uniref:Bifunctional dethiobiotin synthetase/7,8-diamino-pelargonic acid aminotransferase, mitochondrial n=1 Tax=Sesamum angustifolium TaxID=2727405 RepID=A0AAW2J985_9LAMI